MKIFLLVLFEGKKPKKITLLINVLHDIVKTNNGIDYGAAVKYVYCFLLYYFCFFQ